ncbi:hypothetical protein AOXY_G27268 [Acipenser oxyrinchus oxyrinchus]|uniref:Uncharacterized protein n=1 Tax=Acipenser oxyrinchus oxyrinchus TaxID=40147 RepID=A0AAD8FS97_ACIOX|nr:hypothetical protein AOXY_G27268 [Acipenser oxyrinchus oxyrinchus]
MPPRKRKKCTSVTVKNHAEKAYATSATPAAASESDTASPLPQACPPSSSTVAVSLQHPPVSLALPCPAVIPDSMDTPQVFAEVESLLPLSFNERKKR